jgi:hypothetical protein
MRRVSRAVCAAAVLAASVSCGNTVRQGRSPVYLIVNSIQAANGNKPTQFVSFLLSDVITNVTSPAPCSAASPCPTVFNDPGQVTLVLGMKDVGTPGAPTTPTSNNAVTLSRYHVNYRRADGRNTPGVDVPYGFDGAVTGTISSNSTPVTIGFNLVRHDAKAESPLAQLVTNGVVISTLAEVTFYGTDQTGNEVSVTATIQIDFGNFGDTT